MSRRILFAVVFNAAFLTAGIFAAFPAHASGAAATTSVAVSTTSEPKISDWLPGQLKDVVGQMDG
jgi:hypothetical protein